MRDIRVKSIKFTTYEKPINYEVNHCKDKAIARH